VYYEYQYEYIPMYGRMPFMHIERGWGIIALGAYVFFMYLPEM
jgi:hypothetical protein